MWDTETIWFDLTVVLAMFAIGNIALGHFEEHKGIARRILKVLVVAGVVAGLSMLGYRWVAFSVLGLLAACAGYVHLIWLPKHGINGWTGEPRDRYYDLLKVPEHRRRTR